MLKRLLSTVLFMALFVPAALAQTGTLEGTVTDQESGEPLPGVNIFIVETEQGAATDAQGEYTIEGVEPGTYTLRATYVGYNEYEQEVTINQGANTQDIALTEQTQQLDDVVVTAFGLAREERSVSYSVSEVSGEDLQAAGEDDLIGNLSGQVSGVQVVGSPGAALGGTQKIRIRGESGLNESNPLFVVDGTPISNESFASNDRDYGNLSQDINMDDIESISVLKGASASALYGNRASGGVIVIETKGGQAGDQPVQVDFSNSTSMDRVYKLPNYQNEYAGGYSGASGFSRGTLQEYTDPETGETVQGLNYAADESWGPPMEGQEYRPWYSWYHGDFTGDGQDDYGTTTTLDPQPDNVRNFYDTGVRISNSLAISGGTDISSYRVSVEDRNQQGVMPNSSLDKTFLNFKGSLQHSDRFTSRVSFNYVNTSGKGRPAQTYSPLQGNPTQMFNQWFQRQLSMDELQNYRLEDGTIATWNIISPENTTPQYWDSPYFTTHENVPYDERDRVYGNYTLNYNISSNLQATARVHGDFYNFNTEDRIATGGLNQDWYRVQQRNNREMNYEGSLQYQEDFQDFSFDGFVGANLRQERFSAISEQTSGGLAVPNLYNIDASTDRPVVSNTTQEKDVSSVYGTVNVGWQDMIYVDATLRNDWSSALPEGNNSYLYYGLSGSVIFTELGLFDDINWLTFGKLRASMAQVGSDVDPYQTVRTFNVQMPREGYAAMSVPNQLYNPDLQAAISTDYEFGFDLRFLDGRLRLDGTYYNSIQEDEILNVDVSASTGYNQMLMNAGKFTTTGLEFQLSGTPIQQGDFSLDLSANWGKVLTNEVNELTENLDARLLNASSFYAATYAREGETWGKIVSNGYLRHEDNNEPIFNPNSGGFYTDTNVDHGTILPDWNGGFRANVSYRNFSVGAFVEFQKGGQFYSISKLFNNYAGLGAQTTGNNVFGNPMRSPLRDQSGNIPVNEDGEALSAIPYDQAGDDSGGMLVEGVDADGNPVQYISNPADFYLTEFLNQEPYIFDASYIKLQSVSVSYNIPTSVIEQLPIRQASVSVRATNPWLIYSTQDDLDPSVIQEVGDEFGGWWEGGTVPGTRSIGFTVNLGL